MSAPGKRCITTVCPQRIDARGIPFVWERSHLYLKQQRGGERKYSTNAQRRAIMQIFGRSSGSHNNNKESPSKRRKFFLSITRRKQQQKQQQQQQQQENPPSTAKIMKMSSSSQRPSSASAVSGSSSNSFLKKELQEVFTKFDKNKDGKISRSEMKEVMKALGQDASEKEVTRIMEEADSDGDGFVDLEEFVQVNTKGVSESRRMKDLEKAFKMYDLDKNGNISAEELHKVLNSLGEPTSLQECLNMIKGVDTNHDGFVNLEEFKSMMANA